MEKHRKSLEDIAWEEVEEAFSDKEGTIKMAAYKSWNNVIEKGKKNGFSNAQASVLAPTGTLMFHVAGSTGSCEPVIALRITKNLAGGGNIVLANEDVEIGLRSLGYNAEQVNDISKFIGKTGTVRNAPNIKPEHYSVFDSSFGNEKGEGSISFEGHLRMVGAIQPFISGAISKTNNLPESATVKEHYDGFLLGKELGLKAISTFRSNSKPSSALSFGNKEIKKLRRGEKEDMPSNRPAHEWEVKINGTPFHILTSEYEDGRPGQITFLSYKSGSTLGATLSTAGISASKALKRGVTLEDVVEGWIGQQFDPHGLVAGHEYIKIASSPLDFAAKLLRLEYLKDKEMANEPEKVNMSKLRGANNGAFRTYERINFDDWDVEQVLNDPETGGFVESHKQSYENNGKSKNNGKGKTNSSGKTCWGCGRIMIQTAPNCFECRDCGDKVGGCGG